MNNLEKTLLALLMYDTEVYFNYFDRLHIDLFTEPLYRQVYVGITEVIKDSGVVDVVSVNAKANAGKSIIPDLTDIENHDVFNINPENVINELTESFKRLELSKLGSILINSMGTESSKTISLIGDTMAKLSSSKTNIVEFKEIIDGLITFINEKKEGLTGIPTGFIEYDRHTKGLQAEDLIIVAGETSMGKTSWAISAITNALMYNTPVLFISLEMSAHQLTARVNSNVHETSSKDVLFGNMDEQKKTKVTGELKSIENYPLYIDDSGVSNFDQIINTIKRYKIQKDIQVCVIDYLQLCNNPTKGGTKEQEIGDMARGFKNIAKQLKINIIALSQLARDKQNPAPNMNRLRQSGQIEEASDQVILLFRPEYYDIPNIDVGGQNYETKGNGVVYIAKGRNVGTTKFMMNFEPERTRWSDYKPIGNFTPSSAFDDPRIQTNHGDNPF